MDFDIHQLDDVESEEFEDAFEAYREALLDQFFASPEGAALLEKIPDAGFWSSALIEYGYNYLGVSLPRMSKADVEELVTGKRSKNAKPPKRRAREIESVSQACR